MTTTIDTSKILKALFAWNEVNPRPASRGFMSFHDETLMKLAMEPIPLLSSRTDYDTGCEAYGVHWFLDPSLGPGEYRFDV